MNKNCSYAWTLMGREFLEVKNATNAVNAYNNAINIDPCDYSALYGLGVAHELKDMPFHAIHYFTQFVKLQPKDPRMWIALAECHEKIS